MKKPSPIDIPCTSDVERQGKLTYRKTKRREQQLKKQEREKLIGGNSIRDH